MTINTAIIPVAGIGTRAFPLTTAIEKCMLPVYAGNYSRPLIDFMVEDCAKASIQRVIFITTERGRKQLSDYFEEFDASFIRQLIALNKKEAIHAEQLRRSSYNLKYEYIVQAPGQYGTAIPLYVAYEALKGEPHFIMMGGDDFVYHPDGTSELKLAIDTWSESKTNHVIMGASVSRQLAIKYAVLQTNAVGNLVTIDEKPPLARVPTHPIVNITRFLFSDSIWQPIIDEVKTNRGSGEHYITYAISDAIDLGQTFRVHRVKGQYLDGGTFKGLEEAGRYISSHPPS